MEKVIKRRELEQDMRGVIKRVNSGGIFEVRDRDGAIFYIVSPREALVLLSAWGKVESMKQFNLK